MRIPRRNRLARVLAIVLLTACAITISTAPARAEIAHPLVASFNGADAPLGPFAPPLLADAIDQTTGDVYVLESNMSLFGQPERGHNVVDKFDASGSYAGVQITGTPQEAFGFSVFSAGLAVDSSLSVNSGDVYVSDIEHHVVDRFSSTGVYDCQISGAETPSISECNGPGSGFAGAMTPAGVAVDSSGDVYVADDAHEAIVKFGPSGGFIGEIKGEGHLSGEMGTIALDASGDLYVTNIGTNVVEFNAKGEFTGVLDSNASFGVGVDPAGGGHVYVGEVGQIAEYEAEAIGAPLDVFPAAGEELVLGLAVDGGTHDLYTAGFNFSTPEVEIFGPAIVVPNVTVGSASSVQETTAIVHGQVDPDSAHGGGNVTECRFEYVTDAQFVANGYQGAATTPCEPAVPYSAPTNVSATLTVVPDTTYHFRLKAVSAGASEAEGESFTTFGPPVIDAESSTARAKSATVRAEVNPFGFDTACLEVQYVDDAGFQSAGYSHASTTPCVAGDLGSGFGDRSASASLTGLRIGTTYHYRFVVSSQSGKATGADDTFTTFGINSLKVEVLDREGNPYTQAGGHPYLLRTSFTVSGTTSLNGVGETAANVKDVETELPPGLLGNPSATQKCTRDQLANFLCSGASQVGVLHVREAKGGILDAGVYNMVPPAGVPAEFGSKLNSLVSAYIDGSVRTGGDYGIDADAMNISTGVGIVGVTAEFWGVPADVSHDVERLCPAHGGESGPCAAGVSPAPFLTNPTSCVGPLSVTLRADAWQSPGDFVSASSTLPAIAGCEKLDFTPSIAIQPDTTVADSPAGLRFDLKVPQPQNQDGLAEANLRKAVVSLPSGMSLSPSAAAGLQACSPAQIGMHDAEEATCPDASKIGSVEITTPLLSDPVVGSVYVAEQDSNPFGSLLAIYIAAQANGAYVKLAGHVVSDSVTGQLTTTFDEAPQLPFSEMRLKLFGGSHGALATPESCGSFTANAAFTPWSSIVPVNLTEQFQFTQGCVSGFAPGFTAGTTNPQAGGFSPFALSFSRSDTDEELSGMTVSMPPGLLAKVAGVPLCSDADANAGSCPEASRVGAVQAGAGPGADPEFLSGTAYLTGPYKGAPYGLAVVVPVLAGPFNLGTVVVRVALRIDSTDAHVTATSDAFPTILEVKGADGQTNGIPVRLKRVDVSIDRPGFTFNPTRCEPTAITGSLNSTGGLSEPVSSRFDIGGCSELPFKPRFSASTRGPGSKANGVSLDVKVTAPGQGPPSTPAGRAESNIRKVEVQLPVALPSRLTTLQKACPAQRFAADPAGCPAASLVGSAVAHTPVLPDPLAGPAYLVSHAGAAFPDVVIVLQGDHVTVQLTGKTHITKGITYSKFEAVPDAPISSFELNLPQGPFSVLAAGRNLCARTSTVKLRRRVALHFRGRTIHVLRTVIQRVPPPLLMPTTITAQNGATITQATKITLAGCPKVQRPAVSHRRVKKS